jgi:hypothetical protein
MTNGGHHKPKEAVKPLRRRTKPLSNAKAAKSAKKHRDGG